MLVTPREQLAAAVHDDVPDLGVLPLRPGASVRGRIRILTVSPIPTHIRARHEHGVTIEAKRFRDYIPETYAIANLWPGSWTLELMKDEEVMASIDVVFRESETVDADLVVP